MNLKKHIRLKNSNNRERQLTEDEQALYNSLIAQVESNSASGAAVKEAKLMADFNPDIIRRGGNRHNAYLRIYFKRFGRLCI